MSRRRRTTEWTIRRVTGDRMLEASLTELGDDDWMVQWLFSESSDRPGVYAYRVVAWRTVRPQQEVPRGKEGDAK